jgi:hypothetical protein
MQAVRDGRAWILSLKLSRSNMDTLKMKSNADTGSTPPPSREAESERERAASERPRAPDKIPSWRPTVPGVQPRPTLHGVQPLITLRGLNSPTEHDLPIRRDTPQDPLNVPFEALRFGAPRVPTGLELSLDEPAPDFDEAPAPSSGSRAPSRPPEQFERARRVRRWGLGIAVGFGSFALVLGGFILVSSLLRRHEARVAPPSVRPAPIVAALGNGEIVPPPPAVDQLPSPQAEPSTLPEPEPLAPSSPDAPSAEREASTPLARVEAAKPATPPTRPNLFSQVPVRPGAD